MWGRGRESKRHKEFYEGLLAEVAELERRPPEEKNAEMRQIWGLVPEKPEVPGALGVEDIKPNTFIRRNYQDPVTGRWHKEDYRVISEPEVLPREDQGYFQGGGLAVKAYLRMDSPLIPMTAADFYASQTEVRTVNLSSAGVVPYETAEGQVWTERVYTTLVPPEELTAAPSPDMSNIVEGPPSWQDLLGLPDDPRSLY
jgi:hypothetical protein